MNIIKISNLNKSFGEVRAVQDLSLKVKEGELFAFLGVNGAGKSTAISIMCGQLAKDSGKVIIDDLDLDFDMSKIKNKLGVVFQNSVLDKALTVKDNLESRAALYGINGKAFKNRLSELSQLLEFDDLLGRAVGKLSADRGAELMLRVRCFMNRKYLSWTSRQRDLILRQENYFGM